MSALTGKKENAVSGVQTDSVRREMLAVSATVRISVEKQHGRPLLLNNRRRQTTGKTSKGKSPRDSTLVETVRTRRVVLGILPYVKITKQSGCKFGEKWIFRHKEVDSQPDKKPKNTGCKGSVALLKNSKQLGCVFQDFKPPKSKSILRKGP